VSRARAKGTAWESCVVDFLRSRGWPNAERRALNGRADRGDIAGVAGVVIEAKNARAVDLAGWLREAHVEALNDRARHGVVWFKRRGKASAGDGYVVMDGHTFVALLDEAGYQ
jgi:hypothetical protein